MFKGIGASPGIAIGTALVYTRPEPELPRHTLDPDDVAKEMHRLSSSISEARAQVNAIRMRTEAQLGNEQGAIFQTQLIILEDPILLGEITALIKEDYNPAELAVKQVTDRYIALLKGTGDEVIGERWADVADVGRRVINNLLGIRRIPLATMAHEAIVVASDLTPSDTVQLPRDKVLAFVTEHGGRTSHSAIMARSLEIPAVVGAGNILTRVRNGDNLVVDGDEGLVFINPDVLTLEKYKKRLNQLRLANQELKNIRDLPAVTRDGYRMELGANIGSPEEVEAALAYGAEVIGLYRTEFLYLGRPDMPGEEEQVAVYTGVVEKMKGRPVVIRTLDIGGDKPLPDLSSGGEVNPFLGWRGIRLSLDRKDLFKIQLRAILRAGAAGPVRIMFPLVVGLQEYREAKEILAQAKEELAAQGLPFDPEIQVGIMVETPAAAVITDLLAREVDFFSIGTNDLIQYTLAVDRTNEQVAHLYDHYHPAVLRLIEQVVKGAARENKKVSICGEMAGDPVAVPLLLGLGLTELSMAPGAIPKVKQVIRSLTTEEAGKLADEVIGLKEPSAVREKLAEKVRAPIKQL
ncbi:MAG: phosphoenolpyruvate--protein phosphotransferase [Thermincolia bacterium]